jgi:hypothetical protein
MRRKKELNKDLLNEEIQKFKMMSEYKFISDETIYGTEPEGDIILGSMTEEEEEEEDIELPFGSEDVTDSETEETADEESDEPAEEEQEEIEEPIEEPAEEGGEVELDVTQLVKGSEEAKESADAANEKIDQLMQMVSKLEDATSNMDIITDKIDNLESEIEKRNPTEDEKLEMRSLSSAPYNLKLTDFWKDQEGIYDVMGTDDEEKEYVLTKDDVDGEYNELDIKNSFEVDEDSYEVDDI